MSEPKKIFQKYVHVCQNAQSENTDVEVYTMKGFCTDEFFLRTYMTLQCIYSEYMIPCKSQPFQKDDGSWRICFVTKIGFSNFARRFLIKIPAQHKARIEN